MAQVVCDIAALREDDGATLEWLDRGFASTTSWAKSAAMPQQVPQSPGRATSRTTLGTSSSKESKSSGQTRQLLSHHRHHSGRSRSPSPLREKRSSSFRAARQSRLSCQSDISPSPSSDACEGACVHKFNMFATPRALSCSSCHQQTLKGTLFYGCSDCNWDICEQCHSAGKVAADVDQEHGLLVGGCADDDVSTDDGGESLMGSCASLWSMSVTDSGSKGDSFSLPTPTSQDRGSISSTFSSSTIERGTSGRIRLGSAMVAAAEAPAIRVTSFSGHQTFSIEEAPDTMTGSITVTADFMGDSPSVRKTCNLCSTPYSGFGDVCAGCRRCGPGGGAQQCETCDIFFQGFGAQCVECACD